MDKLSMWNQHALHRTYSLNLRIGLENRKRKREWLLLTNSPREINMFFYTTHRLHLRIGLENRKRKRLRVDTLNKLPTWNQHVILYNSPPKFENLIRKQKKKRESLLLTNCPCEIKTFFYSTHLLNLRIGLENRKRKIESGQTVYVKSTCAL